MDTSPSKKQKASWVTLHFDGGSNPNPGLSGGGWHANDDEGEEIAYGYVFVGECETNNVAEYTALVAGLGAMKNLKVENLCVKGDSMLAIQQMNLNWKVKSDNLIPLNKQATKLSEAFSRITFRHVKSEHNDRADKLSHVARNLRTTKVFYNKT